MFMERGTAVHCNRHALEQLCLNVIIERIVNGCHMLVENLSGLDINSELW